MRQGGGLDQSDIRQHCVQRWDSRYAGYRLLEEKVLRLRLSFPVMRMALGDYTTFLSYVANQGLCQEQRPDQPRSTEVTERRFSPFSLSVIPGGGTECGFQGMFERYEGKDVG